MCLKLTYDVFNFRSQFLLSRIGEPENLVGKKEEERREKNNDKIFITISKKVTTKTPKNDGRKLNKSAAL